MTTKQLFPDYYTLLATTNTNARLCALRGLSPPLLSTLKNQENRGTLLKLFARSLLPPQETIIVVTGIQAAGKSTVARLLAQRFVRGVHVEADVLQHLIVSGREGVEAAPHCGLTLQNSELDQFLEWPILFNTDLDFSAIV